MRGANDTRLAIAFWPSTGRNARPGTNSTRSMSSTRTKRPGPVGTPRAWLLKWASPLLLVICNHLPSEERGLRPRPACPRWLLPRGLLGSLPEVRPGGLRPPPCRARAAATGSAGLLPPDPPPPGSSGFFCFHRIGGKLQRTVKPIALAANRFPASTGAGRPSTSCAAARPGRRGVPSRGLGRLDHGRVRVGRRGPDPAGGRPDAARGDRVRPGGLPRAGATPRPTATTRRCWSSCCTPASACPSTATRTATSPAATSAARGARPRPG